MVTDGMAGTALIIGVMAGDILVTTGVMAGAQDTGAVITTDIGMDIGMAIMLETDITTITVMITMGTHIIMAPVME